MEEVLVQRRQLIQPQSPIHGFQVVNWFLQYLLAAQLINECFNTDPLRPSPKLTTEQEAHKSEESFGAPSPAMTLSSIASQEPLLQPQKLFGSEFKFEEHEVSFQRSPHLLEESSDSFNDGLWASRPSHKAKQAEASPQRTTPTSIIDTENKRNSEGRFSIEKLRDGRDDCDHEAEELSCADSPPTMGTNIALPENFE